VILFWLNVICEQVSKLFAMQLLVTENKWKINAHGIVIFQLAVSLMTLSNHIQKAQISRHFHGNALEKTKDRRTYDLCLVPVSKFN